MKLYNYYKLRVWPHMQIHALRQRGWSGRTRDMSPVWFLSIPFWNIFALFVGSRWARTSRPIFNTYTSYDVLQFQSNFAEWQGPTKFSSLVVKARVKQIQDGGRPRNLARWRLLPLRIGPAVCATPYTTLTILRNKTAKIITPKTCFSFCSL